MPDRCLGPYCSGSSNSTTPPDHNLQCLTPATIETIDIMIHPPSQPNPLMNVLSLKMSLRKYPPHFCFCSSLSSVEAGTNVQQYCSHCLLFAGNLTHHSKRWTHFEQSQTTLSGLNAVFLTLLPVIGA